MHAGNNLLPSVSRLGSLIQLSNLVGLHYSWPFPADFIWLAHGLRNTPCTNTRRSSMPFFLFLQERQDSRHSSRVSIRQQVKATALAFLWAAAVGFPESSALLYLQQQPIQQPPGVSYNVCSFLPLSGALAVFIPIFTVSSATRTPLDVLHGVLRHRQLSPRRRQLTAVLGVVTSFSPPIYTSPEAQTSASTRHN